MPRLQGLDHPSSSKAVKELKRSKVPAVKEEGNTDESSGEKRMNFICGMLHLRCSNLPRGKLCGDN